jgi:hypothetical protein
MDGLFDVGVDPPALLHRGNDGGKIVVGQDHIGCAFCHVGTGQAHGASDIGGLEGRGVIDPVPRHGHDLAPLLPGFHDSHLVLRGHAGVN